MEKICYVLLFYSSASYVPDNITENKNLKIILNITWYFE